MLLSECLFPVVLMAQKKEGLVDQGWVFRTLQRVN